jgi:hypothetical protein
MTLTQKDLERLWPEGPAAAYRATAERLAELDRATTCPATPPDAQTCWDLRHAIQDLMRVEADRIEVQRRAKGLDPRSWLLTSRATNKFCRIVLEGAR